MIPLRKSNIHNGFQSKKSKYDKLHRVNKKVKKYHNIKRAHL